MVDCELKSVEKSAWEAAVIARNATIHDALECLDRSGLQICMVVDENSVLLGSLSDGDLRKHLLDGKTLSSSIDGIFNTDPLVARSDFSQGDILAMMIEHKIHQVPSVSSSGVVSGLFVWHKMLAPKSLDNYFLIMAGGRGTRLKPITETMPKPMIKIGGKPMLEHIIDRAKNHGFSRLIIAQNYLGHVIEDYFGDGSSLGVEIVYLREDEALGTAGALSLLSSCEGILDKPFVVTNGDIITDLNYRALLDFHMAEQSSATMAVRIHSYQNPFGVVETAGLNFKEVREKPTTHSYINAGVYVLDPSVLGLIPPKNVVDMTDLFNMAARVPDKNVMVYPMKELWMDVGNLQDLAQARSFFEREYCD